MLEAPQRLECTVEGTEWLAPDLALVRLRPPRPVAARAGQFALLRLMDGRLHPLLGRPMSILEAGETLRFLVRRCGEGTNLLTSRRPGEPVLVLGPYGRPFQLSELGGKKLVMVAGGVGLAPMAFAARECSSRGSRPVFLYGAREAKELVLLDELRVVADVELATDDGSAGHHGFVTELLDTLLERTTQVDEIWTCGPEPMMAAVAGIASSHGVPCVVSVESRMACGRGLCLGCAIPDHGGKPRYVCCDGPIFDAKEMYG